MSEEKEVVKIQREVLTIDNVISQMNMINELYKTVMKKDKHYGKIPGTKKETLFKAGAEKLNVMFKLVPKIEGENKIDLGNGHREIEIIIGLYHRENGRFCGQGTGSCSTLETKFRYRYNEESIGHVPKEYWDNRSDKAYSGMFPKKIDGVWMFIKKGDRIENPDIADTYNTVRKMAYKRALVSATITATGVSDIFDQDIENTEGLGNGIDVEVMGADDIKKQFNGKEIMSKEEALRRYKELPNEIKEYFKALHFTNKEIDVFCNHHEWDHEEMLLAINK